MRVAKVEVQMLDLDTRTCHWMRPNADMPLWVHEATLRPGAYQREEDEYRGDWRCRKCHAELHRAHENPYHAGGRIRVAIASGDIVDLVD